MNLSLCDEYRFVQGKLIATQSGKAYKFHMDKYDRFYTYIKPYIKAGKVSGLTKLMIDTLTIENADKLFLDEKSFSLNAVILAKDNQNTYWSFDVTINNIKINCIDVSKLSYESENLVCSLCEMEIPYQTEIHIVERVD
ncbi:MAG: hypothetical protein IJW94_00230 [Oscillospiraceae bacterium]|nr:hypothetical protein [Oscillospiraceae bacterium]